MQKSGEAGVLVTEEFNSTSLNRSHCLQKVLNLIKRRKTRVLGKSLRCYLCVRNFRENWLACRCAKIKIQKKRNGIGKKGG